MRLPMFFSLTGHTHIVLKLDAIPGVEFDNVEAHLDLTLHDHDGDGDPSITVKWNLPGTDYDSGPEGVSVEVPITTLLGNTADLIAFVLNAAGLPGFVVTAAKAALSAASGIITD